MRRKWAGGLAMVGEKVANEAKTDVRRSKAFEGLDLADMAKRISQSVGRDWRLPENKIGVTGVAALEKVAPARASSSEASVSTKSVIDSLLASKRHKRVKASTFQTYEKKLRQFERSFARLPVEPEPIIGYLSQFGGATGRHRRNHQDLLGMLYEHAVKHFGLLRNPLLDLERPIVSTRPIRTLSLMQVNKLLGAPQDDLEALAIELLVGHGWRQIEVRRLRAGHALAIHGGLIEVEGKERREMTPILPETAARALRLAEGMAPGDHIFRARRFRGGRREPLGEDGMRDLVDRLLGRAGIEGIAGHDLRRTFATLARRAGADEFLTMRLLRDKIPGTGSRYIDFPSEELAAALRKYSPVSLVKGGADSPGRGSAGGEGEKSALPAPKTEKPREPAVPEAKIDIGGGGGESNSIANTDEVAGGPCETHRGRFVAPSVAPSGDMWYRTIGASLANDERGPGGPFVPAVLPCRTPTRTS